MTDGNKRKGFASMSPERRSEIASLGGLAAQRSGKGHKFTSITGRMARDVLRTVQVNRKLQELEKLEYRRPGITKLIARVTNDNPGNSHTWAIDRAKTLYTNKTIRTIVDGVVMTVPNPDYLAERDR